MPTAITITITDGRAIVADGRLVAGESADVSVTGGVPAALYLVDASRDVVAACTSFVAGESSATGELNLATVPLAEIVAEVPAGRAIPLQAILEDAAGAVIGYGLLNVVSAPMPDALDPLDIDLYIRAADIRALFADVPTAYADQRSLSASLSQVVGILQRIGLCAALGLGLRASATEWQDVPADTVIGDGLAITNGAIIATAQGGGIDGEAVTNIVRDYAVPATVDGDGIVTNTGSGLAFSYLGMMSGIAYDSLFRVDDQQRYFYFPLPDTDYGDWPDNTLVLRGDLSGIVGAASNYTDAAVASATARVDVASSAVIRYASGVLRLDVPALATLAADTSGWPDGAAVMCRLTAHGAYAVAPGLDLLGYGFWPTNAASVVLVRDGSRVLANVMEGN